LTNKTLSNPTINTPEITGGTINNTFIGITTPSTGKFSSMTVTGETTLNGVTNNGNLHTDSITLNDVQITATGNELNYLDGVRSNIQSQLDNKLSDGNVLKPDGNQSDGKLFISNDDGKGSWQTIDAIPNNSIQITKIAGSDNEYQVLVSIISHFVSAMRFLKVIQ